MKCHQCNTNMGRSRLIDFTDLARVRLRQYTCPKCKSRITINADTKDIISHMTVYQP